MTGYTTNISEVVYSGPPANYPAAGASSIVEVSAMVGATGVFSQPYFPGGFWQQGRQNQVARFTFALLVNAAATTTLQVRLRLNPSPNAFNTADPLLIAYNALTVSSYASGTIYGTGIIQSRGQGYGTTTVANNLITSGEINGQGNSLAVNGAGGPTALTTTDFSVNQWLELSVQFNTSSASNNATLEQFVLEGMN
jgi:hypothetical protein